MKRYIGTKVVNATPMTRWEYNAYRGWQIPEEEKQFDVFGYLVEYTDGGKGNDSRHAGYISWSPKNVFDAAYNERPAVDGLQPHQQRVVDEKADLDDRRQKLQAFLLADPRAVAMDEAEKSRMERQYAAMSLYSDVLAERIDAWGVPNDDFLAGKAACDLSGEKACEACE